MADEPSFTEITLRREAVTPSDYPMNRALHLAEQLISPPLRHP